MPRFCPICDAEMDLDADWSGRTPRCPQCRRLVEEGSRRKTRENRPARRPRRRTEETGAAEAAPKSVWRSPWPYVGGSSVLAVLLLIVILVATRRSDPTPPPGEIPVVLGNPGGPPGAPPPILNPGDPPRFAGGNQQVQFLGAVGQGRRFVIIADRSGSMNARVRLVDPLTKAATMQPSIVNLQDELVRTLAGMQKGSFFYVSFFDDTTIPMPNGDTWVEGGGDQTDLGFWIRSIAPRGGTNPLPAFRKAFALDPAPDVIFFMTDGQFGDITREVARMNEALPRKAIINTIHFENSGIGAGSTSRYAKLQESFALPPEVTADLGRFGPGRVIGSFKQLEDLAAQSGGNFRVYGAADAAAGAGGAKRPPVLALRADLTPLDPTYEKRPRCHCKAFPVTLQAGRTYEIDMIGTMDPYLYLEDGTGRVVAANDDGGVGLNSLITFTPPATGPYRIVTTTCGSGRSGPFVLLVTER